MDGNGKEIGKDSADYLEKVAAVLLKASQVLREAQDGVKIRPMDLATRSTPAGMKHEEVASMASLIRKVAKTQTKKRQETEE